MTNLISQICLTFVLVTNWTGVVNGPNELGYVSTNHVLTVIYEGATNDFQLKQTVSDVAVWRKALAKAYGGSMTNWNVMPYFEYHNLVLTNRIHPEMPLNATNIILPYNRTVIKSWHDPMPLDFTDRNYYGD